VDPTLQKQISTEGVLIAVSEMENMRSLICTHIRKARHSPSKPDAI